MLRAMNATEAKKEFLQLLDKCTNSPFLITRNGKPVAVILDAEEYERIMETIKFFTFPQAHEEIKKWLEEK